MEPVKTIVVIPAEGDSTETAIWHVKYIELHYRNLTGEKPKVLIFKHDTSQKVTRGSIATDILLQVREFVERNDSQLYGVEIHAQGGLGAVVACEFLRYCPERIKRVFLIGGAPCEAMTWAAKIFHQWLISLWYALRWMVPFFADDPNPQNDLSVQKIKQLSTDFMRENPELYREQIRLIGRWNLPKAWRVPERCRVYFIPNGQTVRSELRDNTYDNAKAAELWRQHGVIITEQPEDNFSFYTLAPTGALCRVMDAAREREEPEPTDDDADEPENDWRDELDEELEADDWGDQETDSDEDLEVQRIQDECYEDEWMESSRSERDQACGREDELCAPKSGKKRKSRSSKKRRRRH